MMCKPRGEATMSLISYTPRLNMASSTVGKPRLPLVVHPRSPAFCPGWMAVSHSECFRASTWKVLGLSTSDLSMVRSSCSACACDRVTGPFPFKRSWEDRSMFIFNSLCFSKMWRHRTFFSVGSSFLAFFSAACASALSCTTCPTSNTETMHAAGAVEEEEPPLELQVVASCAMTSEATLGCLGNWRMRFTISSFERADTALLKSAK
mmetsp:Transcript_58839/g.137428  ORF Transcript_58839/g.137428 Transcript_58839/m.137428 type:complete len:207 (-) Transcript_58839:1891-2511(-)